MENIETNEPVLAKKTLKGPHELLTQSVNFFIEHHRFIFIIVFAEIFAMVIGVLADLKQNEVALVAIIQTIASAFSYVALIIFAGSNGTEQSMKNLFEKFFSKIFSLIWVGFLSFLEIFAGFLLFIIPGIYFAYTLVMANLFLIIKDKKGYDALSNSRYLTRGDIWKLIFRYIYLGVAMLLFYLIIFALSTLVLGTNPIYLFNDFGPQNIDHASSYYFVKIIISIVRMYVIAPISIFYTYYIFENLIEVKGWPMTLDQEIIESKRTRRKSFIYGIVSIIGLIIIISVLILSFIFMISKSNDKRSDKGMVEFKTLQINN